MLHLPSTSLRTLLAIAVAFPVGFSASQAIAKTKPRKHSKALPDNAPDVVIYGQREDLMRFAADVSERQGLDLAWTRSALAQSRFIPSVVKYIMPPPAGTAKNWAADRARFVEPVRIKAGIAFWNANEAWLRLAEERYGVPAEII